MRSVLAFSSLSVVHRHPVAVCSRRPPSGQLHAAGERCSDTVSGMLLATRSSASTLMSNTNLPCSPFVSCNCQPLSFGCICQESTSEKLAVSSCPTPIHTTTRVITGTYINIQSLRAGYTSIFSLIQSCRHPHILHLPLLPSIQESLLLSTPQHSNRTLTLNISNKFLRRLPYHPPINIQ